VKKIVDEHGARIELVNRNGSNAGASVIIVFRRLAASSASGTQRRVA
jgi:nitrogen fixation/metabolism regulation signal transduction histidine kinase